MHLCHVANAGAGRQGRPSAGTGATRRASPEHGEGPPLGATLGAAPPASRKRIDAGSVGMMPPCLSVQMLPDQGDSAGRSSDTLTA